MTLAWLQKIFFPGTLLALTLPLCVVGQEAGGPVTAPKPPVATAEESGDASPATAKPAVQKSNESMKPSDASDAPSEAGESDQEASGETPTKLVRRPSASRPPLTPEQRAEWVDRLRQLYVLTPERWPTPQVDSTVRWQEIGNLPKVEHPQQTPFSPEKARLVGQRQVR